MVLELPAAGNRYLDAKLYITSAGVNNQYSNV